MATGDSSLSATDPGLRTRTRRPVLLALGTLLAVLALAALGYELVAALQSGSYRMIAAGELWFTLDAGSLNLTQAVTQRYLLPALWDPVLVGLLQWPAWALLGIPALLLLLLGYAGRRPAGPG